MRVDQKVILDATLRLIAREGVGAVRYREVAAESGVALGTISYQYSAREDLVRAAFAHFLSESTRALRDAASRIHGPEDVAGILVELLKADFADPTRPHLAEYELLTYAARDPLMAAAIAEWDRSTIAEFAEVAERAGLPSPFAVAHTLFDMTRGFQLGVLGQSSPDLEDFHKRVSMLLTAFASGPSRESATPRTTPAVTAPKTSAKKRAATPNPRKSR